ncbi:LacI family DNA-binding transcriptional regulator [Bifidobacterium simiarum]|uniref:LacI family transcriptional regulator n=1 Tax=Bifidobacterium simiarum TaxID=2045441 RepID=A0A2M9HCW3_9BIFI|nr:LacI family DNA-binding transcriptional regulator [Bifidobacterium simiarum]PJM74659.1 LacI family transcriptional regulator [Bifidobacterium simiarum]
MVRATISDVAARAGVSEATVSRALRGNGKVREATRAKVRRAAEELHFSFSRSAASLASGKTNRVTILLSAGMNTWFSSSALQGIYEVLAPQGYDLVPCVASSKRQLKDFFAQLPDSKNSDGMIVVSIDLNEEQRAELRELALPSVGLNTPSQGCFDASVRIDDREGMTQAVRLLVSLGHECLAFVDEPARADFEYSASVRADGFRRAGLECGLDESRLVHVAMPLLSHYESMEEAASVAATKIVSDSTYPTGICVRTDAFAVLLIDQLERCGVQVPRDISVIGFDDSTVAPVAHLTTIRQNPVALGRAAADRILRLMRGEPLPLPHELVSPSLILRRTVDRMRRS